MLISPHHLTPTLLYVLGSLTYCPKVLSSQEFSLATMGALTPVCEHARHFAQPTIKTSENFPVLVSSKKRLKIPQESSSQTSLILYCGLRGVVSFHCCLSFLVWEPDSILTLVCMCSVWCEMGISVSPVFRNETSTSTKARLAPCSTVQAYRD